MVEIKKLNKLFHFLEKVQKALLRELIGLSPFLFKSKHIKPKALLSHPIRFNNSHFDDPDNVLKTPPKKADEKWGGARIVFYNYDSTHLDYMSNRVKYFKGSPQVVEHTDVIYYPQYSCLYHLNGERVELSCPNPRETHKGKAGFPFKIKVPDTLERISKPMLYGGFIMRNHFGVFLTTGISRLWYAAFEQKYPVVCFGIYCRESFKRNYVDSFFDAAKFDKRRFLSFPKPVILEKVIIPYPSTFERYEIFDAHKIIPENIARNILKGYVEQTSQPLYLSRRLLAQDRRLIMNEDKLEQELVKKGVALCYPEQISLEEQIRLFNKHKTIIGTVGSALHNILFNVLDKEQMICLNYRNDIYPTFLLFDMLKNMHTLHIGALDFDSNCPKTGTHDRNRVLDLDVAFDGLQKYGIL